MSEERQVHPGLAAWREMEKQLVAAGREVDEDGKPIISKAERRRLSRQFFPALCDHVDGDANGDVREGWLTVLAGCRDHDPTNHPERCSSEPQAPGELRCADPNRNDDETDLLAAFMRDIFRHDQSTPGKSGPKPMQLDLTRVYELMRQFAGQDHTILPFQHAFAALKGMRSVRGMAAKCGFTRNKVDRLLHGQKPSLQDMEQIAGAFRKHPSFFKEYRLHFLQQDLTRTLEDAPETAIDLYRKRARQ